MFLVRLFEQHECKHSDSITLHVNYYYLGTLVFFLWTELICYQIETIFVASLCSSDYMRYAPSATHARYIHSYLVVHWMLKLATARIIRELEIIAVELRTHKSQSISHRWWSLRMHYCILSLFFEFQASKVRYEKAKRYALFGKPMQIRNHCPVPKKFGSSVLATVRM